MKTLEMIMMQNNNNMRKIVFIVALFMATVATATSPIDSARSYVNSNIVTNGSKAITGLKMNTALNGIIDAIDSTRVGIGVTINTLRKVDTIYANTGADSLVYKISGVRYAIAAGSTTAQNITYSALKSLYDGGTLTPLQWYRITDYATIYDQTISGVTKTAAGEVLLVQATSANTLSNVAKSESFPDDIIHYDITKNTTIINAAAAKGKITYREDKAGNKAYFDWRKVLQYNPNDASEALIYDLTQPLVSANEVKTTPEIAGVIFSSEFPATIFKGLTFFNSNNIFYSTIFNGEFSENTSNLFAQCTFGDAFTKSISTNYFIFEVGGIVDRVVECAFLDGNISGRLYWVRHIFFKLSSISGDFDGISNLSWVNTNSNCNVESIVGITHHSEMYGFSGCTITGTTASDYFGNLTIETKVTGKTIDQASYPELFDRTLHKTIYAKPSGEIWYRWLDDSNVWQFEQIL